MKIGRLVACSAAVALTMGLTTSANAAVFIATFQGTVTSGSDLTGLFGAAGANLAGDTYTAVYTVNDSVSDYQDIEPPGLSHLFGGAEYLPAHDGMPSTGTESPVSATITINGITVAIPGVYFGALFRSVQPGSAEIFYTAEDQTTVGDISSSDGMENKIFSFVNPVVTDYDYHDGFSYTVQPHDMVGTSFYDYAYNTDTGVYSTDVTATLAPTSVTVTGAIDTPPPPPPPPPGVPEPATWSMLILGIGLIGFAARRRNEGTALAV